MKCTQNQLTRIVPGVVGAVAKEQLLRLKTADSPANIVTQGTQARERSGHKGVSCKSARV